MIYGIGLDLSLTSSGLAAIDHKGYISETAAIKTDPAKGVIERVRRYETIKNLVVEFVNSYSPCHILIEGYIFGGFGYGIHDRCELGGIIRHQIWTHCKDVMSISEIPPTSLQKAITGYGGGDRDAKKKAMKAAVDEIFGSIALSTDDEYDAVGLALVAGGWR